MASCFNGSYFGRLFSLCKIIKLINEMTVYFFDYYHPFAGLCNQLYLITNHIHQAILKESTIYINKVNIDIFHKERIPAGDFFDIPKTNENLKKLTGMNVLETEVPEMVITIPKLCIYPVSSIEILNCLEFNENILKNVDQVKSNLKSYNSIHFRLDIDAVIHYTFGKKVYHRFMDLCNQSLSLGMEYYASLDQELVEKYCSFLMEQYFTFITKFGFEKCWYISTSINKWEIHKPMEKYLFLLVNFIISNKGRYMVPDKFYNQRELNGLVDLLVLRDSDKMIGFEGSSFSEGYCLKVNSIRNPGKEYLFVKEYP